MWACMHSKTYIVRVQTLSTENLILILTLSRAPLTRALEYQPAHSMLIRHTFFFFPLISLIDLIVTRTSVFDAPTNEVTRRNATADKQSIKQIACV